MKRLYKILSGLLNGRHYYLTRGLLYLGRSPRIALNKLDYVRVATLELLAEEIAAAGATGVVAELGVFRGDFAKYLNEVFPGRELYLFDTFEGFDARDLEVEKTVHYKDHYQDFNKTSEALVLSKMPHPERCRLRKGYFPQTAEGLEDLRFCLVSIDADLYEPILSGLRFFYPRLDRGGAIMVHDYNNSEYPGARQAVHEFCAEAGVVFVPIPDIGGTVVLRKG